jgi:hypothetical protein
LAVWRETKRHSPTPPELKLLRALIERCAGSSPPSQLDVERGLESGLGRLMLVEGQVREQTSRAGRPRPGEAPCDDHDLAEEIRALREAVTELRMRTSAGESAPLAQGFVIARGHGLGGGGLPADGRIAAGAGMGSSGHGSQTAGARRAGC